jgi:hypothetical protein
VFGNRALRVKLGLMRNEVMGGWRKLHNEVLRDLYSSPSINRMIWLKMRLVGHAARLEEKM